MPPDHEAHPDFAAELAALTRVMLAVPPSTVTSGVEEPPVAIPVPSAPDPLTGLMPLEPVPVLFDPIALDMREDPGPVAGPLSEPAPEPEPSYFPALVELDTIEPVQSAAPVALDDGWHVTAPPELDLGAPAPVEEEPETPKAPNVVVPTSTLIAELGFLDD